MKRWIGLLMLCVPSIFTTPVFADPGSIIQTLEGVESDVKGPIAEVNKHVLNIFTQMGIQMTGLDSEQSGSEQTIKGKANDIDVEVKLTQSTANQTHAVVIAKQGTLKWNKDYAQNLLTKIIQSS